MAAPAPKTERKRKPKAAVRHRLEDRFVDRWTTRYPQFPYEREKTIDAWRQWAHERKARGFVSRAVPYKGDFLWPDARVVVEVQGGTWGVGGHSTGTGIERDASKAFTAACGGWVVVALTERMLMKHDDVWLPKLAALIASRIAQT